VFGVYGGAKSGFTFKKAAYSVMIFDIFHRFEFVRQGIG
jgi:hypothetical protein